MIHFLGLGGTDEIGGSCYLYLTESGNLLVDAGLRPGVPLKDALPQLEILKHKGHPPDVMVLTHAHLDHVGALPLVTRMFPDLLVYCTFPTARLTHHVLFDTLKIQEQQGETLFDLNDLEQALSRLQVIESHQTIRQGNLEFTLTPSGHLPGASSVTLTTPTGRVFHTGDFNTTSTYTTPAAHLPAGVQQYDAVVTESTYGDTNLPARQKQTKNLIHLIKQAISRGGKVLIPSFALGRAQEIIATLLAQYLGGGMQPVPIHLDGLVRDVTVSYEQLLEHLPEGLQNQVRSSKVQPFLRSPVGLVEDGMNRQRILQQEGPCIIIASSGMLSAGPSPIYARAMLPDPRNLLLIVGHQEADSPGRQLLEVQQGKEVLLPVMEMGVRTFKPVTVHAEVARCMLSGHADRQGILNFLGHHQSPLVLAVHGEMGARHALKQALQHQRTVVLPSAGIPIPLTRNADRPGLLKPPSGPPQMQVQKILSHQETVTAHYDAEMGVLTVHLKHLKDPSLLPGGTYALQLERKETVRLRLYQVSDTPQERKDQRIGQLLKTLRPYPVTVLEAAERAFKHNTHKARHWLKLLVHEGHLQELPDGRFSPLT